MGKITVNNPGFHTSVQDLGRFGYAHLGVPVSGAMDKISFSLANHLLNNPSDAAGLEMTMIGATLVFDEPTLIALCGAESSIVLNGQLQSLNRAIPIKAGDSLQIGRFQSGQRMYLGIKNGFVSEPILNSRSFYKGLTPINKLKQGDSLQYSSYPFTISSPHSHVKPVNWNKEGKILEVYPGPEINNLGKEEYDKLFRNHFTISTLQDRMGIQLEEPLPNDLNEILTAPVYPGTVQLTPSGKLIILMRDAQVTGGYPRVLQLTEKTISLLAQKRPGQVIRFLLLEEG
jgi:biotin-dependent carboxylase-like uncharacterized protein